MDRIYKGKDSQLNNLRTVTTMQAKFIDAMIIAAGGLFFLFSLTLDLFRPGYPGIGFEQMAGMVIGCIIALIGLRRLFLPDSNKWDWLLFIIYLSGILFAGLRPSGTLGVFQEHLFGLTSLNRRDLVVNIAGFIPLGFLTIAVLSSRKKNNYVYTPIVIAITLGGIISTTIETLQFYWVPGRYSSLYDLLSNLTGTFIGIMSYIAVDWYVRRLAN